MRNLFLICIAFAVGLLAGRFSFKQPPSESAPVCEQKCESLSEAKANLISISQNEYAEYNQIKDLKLKYEKADELLGRIMLLFLADVGFKVQAKAEPVMAESIAPPPVESRDAVAAEKPSPLPAPQVLPASSLSGKAGRMRYVVSEEQAKSILDSAIIENPKLAAVNGNYPKRDQLRILEGTFSGLIKFLDGKKDPLNVTWDLQPDYSKNPIEAQFTLRLFGQGKNSESSGNGELKRISSMAEDANGFIVESCGGDCYLQLYSGSSGQLFGNYYESKDGKKFARTGLVDLRK